MDHFPRPNSPHYTSAPVTRPNDPDGPRTMTFRAKASGIPRRSLRRVKTSRRRRSKCLGEESPRDPGMVPETPLFWRMKTPMDFLIFFTPFFFRNFFWGRNFFRVSSRGTFPISLIVPSGKLTLAMEDGPGLSRCIPY